MQMPSFSKNETSTLAALAVFGLVVPNGIFVYYFAKDPGLLRAALANPLALTFILEAVFLMILFAWLVRRLRLKPSALAFIVMSHVGSLAFSVPATLYLAAKKPRQD